MGPQYDLSLGIFFFPLFDDKALNGQHFIMERESNAIRQRESLQGTREAVSA
jgi:hypothetical protein